MVKKFKDSLSHKGDLFKAAKKRVLDYKHDPKGDREAGILALDYLRTKASTLKTPPLLTRVPFFSNIQSEYLKDLKYHLHGHNLRSNSLAEHVGRNTKEAFASLRSIQQELAGLSAEVGEEEIKLLYNFSKVHLNTFTRGIDRPKQWGDQAMLQDFKTGFSYREKFLLSVQQNAGLTLPVRHMQSTPIQDIYIIDEATDVGDSLIAIESSDPMNLTRKNKAFKHVIIRREYNHTSRKFKSRTTFDEYPYNCVSTLTLEIEMPNIVMINYLKFEPIGSSTLTVAKDGLTYKSEDGSEVSLNSTSVAGELSTTLFFQPIHTKYLTVKFEQYGTVGRKDLVIGDRKIAALNKLLTGAEFTTKLPENADHVIGRVYDFSIADMSVGLISFEPKGIFRSGTSLNIDSPIGFDIKWAAEQLLPVETFDTYLNSIILPEGKVLYEFYCYLRLFGGGTSAKAAPIAQESEKRKVVDQTKDTLIVDSIVPMPDSYPIQMEYLKCVGSDARVKLYPDLRWTGQLNCIDKACMICLYDNSFEVSLSSIVNSASGSFLSSMTAQRTLAMEAQGEDPFEPEDDPNTYQITTLDYPSEFIYESTGSPSKIETDIRLAFEDAIINAAGFSNTTAAGTEFNIVYNSPTDDDLAFILDWKFTAASPKLKEAIRQNAQDYILIDPGVFPSQGKSWNLLGSSTLYAITNRVETDNTFASALNSMKLLGITVYDVVSVGSTVTISVNLHAVRSPLTEKDTKEQSPENSAALIGMSLVNYSAWQLCTAIKALPQGLSSVINEEFFDTYPTIIPLYNNYRNSIQSNKIVWEKRILGLAGNGPVDAGSEPVTAYFKTQAATGPHGYFAARAWDEESFASASLSKINSSLFLNIIENPDKSDELFSPTLPNVPETIPASTLTNYLNNSMSQSAAMMSAGPQQNPQIQQNPLHIASASATSNAQQTPPMECSPYLVFKMIEPHGYAINDVIAFHGTPASLFPTEYKVAIIFDAFTFGILASSVPSLNSLDPTQFECTDFSVPPIDIGGGTMGNLRLAQPGRACCLINAQQHCLLNLTTMNDPLEVYQDSQLLIVGRDYLISLNDKSSWLGSWALGASFEEYHRKAKAGRFHIKFLNQDPASIYWIKYRVKKNQQLSMEGLINLKNGRVVCDQSLRGSSGTIDVAAIARTNSTNPHITPILREYSLRVQEEPHVKRDSGKLKRKRPRTSNRDNTM